MRTPEQIQAFKARGKVGLLRTPTTDQAWVKWHSRRGMFADLAALDKEPQKPTLSGSNASQPWQVDQWKYAERTRVLINDLSNQVMRLRAEKKQADYY